MTFTCMSGIRKYGSLVVSVLNSRIERLGCDHGWGHCVVILYMTLYSHSASLYSQWATKLVETLLENDAFGYLTLIVFCAV